MMSPDDEQKVEIGQAMSDSLMMTLFGIALTLAEEETARLVGAGIAVLAGIWFCVSLRRLLALRPREPRLRFDDRIDPD